MNGYLSKTNKFYMPLKRKKITLSSWSNKCSWRNQKVAWVVQEHGNWHPRSLCMSQGTCSERGPRGGTKCSRTKALAVRLQTITGSSETRLCTCDHFTIFLIKRWHLKTKPRKAGSRDVYVVWRGFVSIGMKLDRALLYHIHNRYTRETGTRRESWATLLHCNIQKLFGNLFLLITTHKRYTAFSLKTSFFPPYLLCLVLQDKQVATTSAGHTSDIHKKETFITSEN